MRRAAKIDANHTEIVKALRGVGCTVQTLAAVGSGCPDILVGFRGHNMLMEIKDGNKPPSARQLTIEQAAWHQYWTGQVGVVETAGQAIDLLNGLSKRTVDHR